MFPRDGAAAHRLPGLRLPAGLHGLDGFLHPGEHLPGSFATDNEIPQIALDSNGYSHVVWLGYNGTDQVYYSTNAGGSWSVPVNISTNTFENDEPRIALDSDNHAHVVWYGYDGNRDDEDIYYSSNAGGTWSPRCSSPPLLTRTTIPR